MKKIVLKARIINWETTESHKIAAHGIDASSEKYIKRSIGAKTSKAKRIRFADIIREFQQDDIVKITFEKVKK